MERALVTILATMMVLVPLANYPIMSGKFIWLFSHHMQQIPYSFLFKYGKYGTPPPHPYNNNHKKISRNRSRVR